MQFRLFFTLWKTVIWVNEIINYSIIKLHPYITRHTSGLWYFRLHSLILLCITKWVAASLVQPPRKRQFPPVGITKLGVKGNVRCRHTADTHLWHEHEDRNTHITIHAPISPTFAHTHTHNLCACVQLHTEEKNKTASGQMNQQIPHL